MATKKPKAPQKLTPEMLVERVTVFDVDDLRLMEANPNQGDVGAVHTSMEEFGQVDTILVVDGTVVDGNHRVTAERQARRFGGKLAGIDATGLDITAVRAMAMGLALNRTARLGHDDLELLSQALLAIQGEDEALLQAAGWSLEDLDDLLRDIDHPLAGPSSGGIHGDPDDVPDRAPAITKPGDLWLLGPHRLWCGDAIDLAPTVTADADRYHLISDPPYGMGLTTDGWGSPGRPSKFDGLGDVEWDAAPFDVSVLLAAYQTKGRRGLWGANYYHANGLPAGTWWVWDKRTSEAADACQGVPFELFWIEGKCGHQFIRYNWAGLTSQERTGPDAKVRYHPTQKPIAVVTRTLDYLTEAGDTIVDPYGGSGTTLIAAQASGRVARLIELDPHYCDVICRRFQRATGVKPILEATGQPHDFDVDP